MPLTSSSTLAEVKAAMEDNASYAVHNSLSECEAYIDAVNRFMVRAAEGQVHGGKGGGEELRLGKNLEILERALRTAINWQAAQAGTAGAAGGVVYADLSGPRN